MEEQAYTDKHPRWARIRRFNFIDWLYDLIGSEWGGNVDVPLSHHSKTVNSKMESVDYVISFLNDSSDIGLGYPDEWHGIYDRKAFRKMICWYVWKSTVCEWFGLRRWIFYKLLIIKCDRHKVKKPE